MPGLTCVPIVPRAAARLRRTRLTPGCISYQIPYSRSVKRKKPQVEKPSVGTVIGAKYRARCNELAGREREKLNDEFMKLYYADAAPQPARRR